MNASLRDTERGRALFKKAHQNNQNAFKLFFFYQSAQLGTDDGSVFLEHGRVPRRAKVDLVGGKSKRTVNENSIKDATFAELNGEGKKTEKIKQICEQKRLNNNNNNC